MASVVPPPAIPAAMVVSAAPWWQVALRSFNASPLAWGAAALVVNLGARFVSTEFLSPEQQRAIASPVARRLVLFCMAFLVTHNLLLSAALATVVVVLLEGLLRPGSRFCVLSALGGCAPGAGSTGGLADAATASHGGGSRPASHLAHSVVNAVARAAEPRGPAPPLAAAGHPAAAEPDSGASGDWKSDVWGASA